MTKKTFKLFSKEFNFVALMLDLNEEQEGVIYGKLKDKIESAEKSFLVRDYVEYLLSIILVDGDNLILSLKDSLKESESRESYDDALRVLYDHVLDCYPHFCLEVLCGDLNSTITGEEVRFIMEELAKEFRKEEVKSRAKTKVRTNCRIKNLSDIKRVEKYLKKNIIGQDIAIKTVIDALKVEVAGLTSFTSFFFIGPTGVGKTKLAKEVAKKYSANFFKINCAEYAGKHEYSKLIGAPPGYIGHSDQSLLAEKAEKSNCWVFLFDEIEKADPKFYDFLLSLLDEGTCTDNMGKVLDFSKSLFVFTSNQGLHDHRLGERRLGFDSEVITYGNTKDNILSSIKKEFKPEFLNRIDYTVFFNEIDKNSAKKIASLELKNLPVKRTASLLNYIVKEAYSLEYGARNIGKFIKSDVCLRLADTILSDSNENKKISFVPTFEKGELSFTKPKEKQKWDTSSQD